MSKQFILFSLLWLPFTLLYANAEKDTTSYVIKGRLIEAEKEKIMAYANVRLLQPDSSFVAGVRSNVEGLFHLTVSKEGSYLLAVDNIGYESLFHDLHLSKEQPIADLATLTLQPAAILLKNMEVVAAQQQITMRGDTLVYNADAFRVPPGATLGTLLSRLPGITIEDGVIKYQGKAVNKLLINGKDFFSGDLSIALENLPTEMVEAIEAYETRTDADKQKHTDSGERENVLNVTIKKEYMSTWIGNTDLAAGTGDHYSTRLFLTRFTDKLSLSAFGQINNLNDQSEANANGGWRSNDWSPGLNTFRKAGVNAAWDNGKKEEQDGYLKIFGSARMAHNNYNVEEETVGETFYPGDSHNYSNSLHGRKENWNTFTLNGGVTWKIDSLTNVYTRIDYDHRDQHYWGYNRSATFSADPYQVPGVVYPLASLFAPQPNDSLLSMAINSNDEKSKHFYNSNMFSSEFSAGRKLSPKGHRLDLWTYFRTDKKSTTTFSLSDILYYRPDAEEPEQINNQYSLAPNENLSFSGQLVYEHVLSKSQKLTLGYQYNYSYSQNDYTLFQLDSLDTWRNMFYPLGTLPPADSLAMAINWRNCTYTTYHTNAHGAVIQYQLMNKNNLNVIAVLMMKPTHIRMDYRRGFMDTTVVSNRFEITPILWARYNFKKAGFIQAQYYAYRDFPELTQMLDVTDDSNPLVISKGNPDLHTSWTQRFNFNFQKPFGERKASMWANGNYVTSNTAVRNSETYDPVTGVRTIRPENVDGPWSVYLNTGASIPLDAKQRWNFSPGISVNYRENVGFFTSTEDNISQKNTQSNLGCTPSLNLNFRLDKLYLSTDNYLSIGAERNSLQPASNQTSRTLSTGGSVQYEFLWGMTVNSDFHLYSCRGFSSASMNNDQWLWNAGLSQSFLKKKNLVLTVNANDILASRINEWASSTTYGRTSTHNNSFRNMSYVMFHVVYRFSVGKKADSK